LSLGSYEFLQTLVVVLKRQSFDPACLSGISDGQAKFADTTQAINQRMPTIFQLYPKAEGAKTNSIPDR
jgi:hypothetical protein